MAEERASFRVGVDVIVVREGKLLLGLRKKVFGDGTWGLPGGHLEDKESMVEGAARELQEETGLKATKLTFCNIVNNRNRAEHYIHVTFLAEGITGEPQLTEPEAFAEWQWFDLNALPEELFLGHRKQIEMYKNKEGPFGEA